MNRIDPKEPNRGGQTKLVARVPRPADMVAFIRQHVHKPEYDAAPGPAKVAA
jgi:hypothetical protein